MLMNIFLYKYIFLQEKEIKKTKKINFQQISLNKTHIKCQLKLVTIIP